MEGGAYDLVNQRLEGGALPPSPGRKFRDTLAELD